MSTISVIIPAYNAEKFIGEAIESALNQTRPAREIVVVDDASTDRTVEIARGYGDRVQVLVNKVNSGPGHSRNAGVAASTGDYLAFLDADDKWLPEHLEDLAGLLDKWPEAGFAVGAVRVFGDEERISPFFPAANAPTDVFLNLMRGNGIWPTATMVRRSVFQAVGGYTDVPAFYRGRRIQTEDADFILNVALRFRCVCAPRVSALFRRHPDQSTAYADHHRLATFNVKMRMIERMQDMNAYRPLVPVAADRVVRDFEGHLRSARLAFNMVKLRMFIRWGKRHALFRAACRPYAAAFLMPAWVLRLKDRRR